jgi:adenylate cyclase
MRRPFTILVADSDTETQTAVAGLLTDDGYAAGTASDGQEALRTIADGQVDAVLLELDLPRIDGLTLLQSIKGDSSCCVLPVIMTSSRRDRETTLRCLELGAEDCLSKPLDPALLRARITGCLTRKRIADLQGEYLRLVREQAADLAHINRGLTRQIRSRECSPAGSRYGAEPVAILSYRIAGLADVATGRDTRRATRLLESFEQTLDRLVERFEATIAEFTGDSVTLVFHSTESSADQVSHAARMALALSEEIDCLRTDDQPQIGLGAAITIGPARIGEADGDGAGHRLALSAAVRRAIAMSALACSRGDVLITHDALERAGDRVQAAPIGHQHSNGTSNDRFLRVTGAHAGSGYPERTRREYGRR